MRMRLYEAIALGLGEIHFTNDLWLTGPRDEFDGKCMGCLLGAALFAQGERGGSRDGDIDRHLSRYWPWVLDWRYTGAIPGHFYANNIPMSHLLTYLANSKESGRATDEQIIDFIRSVEPKEQEQSQQQETLVSESICVSVSA